MERPPAAAPGTSNNKPNNNNNRRRNNNNNTNNKRRRDLRRGPRGCPPTPQIKVLIRNIRNIQDFGTAQQIIGFVRVLVERANEKLPDKRMQLSAQNLDRLVQQEQAALQEREMWEESLKVIEPEPEEEANENEPNEDESATKDEGEDAAAAGDDTEMAVEETTAPKRTAADIVANVIPAMQSLKVSSEATSVRDAITTTVMYICPPKKTRRRGEKPGCVYLLLTAPTLETKAPPRTVPAPAPVTNADGTIEPAPVPYVDYTPEVTQRRLLLQLAVDSMTASALDDATSKQEWAGSVVEEALNPKPLKSTFRPDRMHGTVQETPDYVQFLERTAHEKQERSERPKPAPGGGLAAAMNAAGDNGQPTAALVLHLQAKHDELNKRNKAKRKARDSTRRTKGGKEEGFGKAAGAKKKKKGKNKKGPKGAAGKAAKLASVPTTSAWKKG